VETDSWDANLPADCRYDNLQGGIATDPDCLETQINVNQLKDGVFDGGYAFEGVAAGAYIVEMVAPPGYRQIKEEDQNTDQGDDYVPAVPPPPCAGPLHLVNDARNPADGQMTPLCDSKFVRVVNGTNPPAEFYVMTDFDDSVDEFGDPVLDFAGTTSVPVPGRIRGFMSDDLNVDFVPGSPNYQGKRGVPNTPIGILDFMDNEIAVVNTDAYGYFEVLLPSGDTIACPTPGGLCPSMYKVVGNYPGQDPLNPLPNWNPNYTTLTLPTDIWTGKATYSDIAIIPITAFAGFANQPVCSITGPDVKSVSAVTGTAGNSFNIAGSGFGGVAGSVTLGGAALTVNSWSDIAINVTIPNTASPGPQQLLVTDSAGVTGDAGITFHVMGGSYNPTILTVGGGGYASIQNAVDAANDGDLIVVEPGTYYVLPIIYRNVKLQGYGPGVTSIDGRFFGFGPGTATDPNDWIDFADSLNALGPTEVPIGQVITVVATSQQQHNNASFTTQIDGFTIIGGDTFKVENNAPRLTQGGGIYTHSYARRLQVSNNQIQSNSGSAGGGVVLGQAYVGDNHNENIRIHHNRILNNGGFILAGGVGIFTGADNYEIDHNQLCGNYSAEYGGGISHFGMSDGGQIHDNKIVFNSAFDEGGGIIIASELPLDPSAVPDGSGEVTIERNLIQQNISNDDGGGIRLLAPIAGPVHILNNMIVNNLATDIGGGIALDDALEVEIINNTVAHNVSTATAEDADRSPSCAPNGGFETCAHAAGIASTGFSAALLDSNPAPSTDFTDPLMFNNVLWQNQAFHLNQLGTLEPATFIDLEVLGTTAPETMTPNYSVLTALYGSGVGNTDNDPMFVDGSVFVNFQILPFVADPTFVSVQILTTPADPQGDYHLNNVSSAIDLGVLNFGGFAAPLIDIEGDTRDANPDSGADEFGEGTEPPGNQVPTAFFTYECNGLTCTFDASGSFDTDGNIVVYSWDFGDLTGGAGVNPSRTYASAGTYTVMLTVTDDGVPSANDEYSLDVTVAEEDPIASFTYFCTGLSCDFDASGSSDPDGGTIVSFDWDFGGDGTGSGVMPTHGFISAGTYNVMLTVTDDEGATGMTSQSVMVSEALNIHLADLVATSAPVTTGPEGRWDAIATVTVHDGSHNLISGVTVTVRFTWRNKNNNNLGTADMQCVTNASGQCQVSRRINSNNMENDVQIEVLDLTHATLPYDAGANDVAVTTSVNKP